MLWGNSPITVFRRWLDEADPGGSGHDIAMSLSGCLVRQLFGGHTHCACGEWQETRPTFWVLKDLYVQNDDKGLLAAKELSTAVRDANTSQTTAKVALWIVWGQGKIKSDNWIRRDLNPQGHGRKSLGTEIPSSGVPNVIGGNPYRGASPPVAGFVFIN